MSKSFEGRSVTFAKLHGSIFLKDISSNFGPTLDTEDVSGKRYGLKMWIQEGCLVVAMKGREFPVPLTNVSHWEFAPSASLSKTAN